MPLHFKYDKEKDIDCLLSKGKSSNNNPNPTQVYALLVERYGAEPTRDNTSEFIDAYLAERGVSIEECISTYTKEWESIALEFTTRGESIFKCALPHDITVFLTVNNRNPYSIDEQYFYATAPSSTVRKTIMHELWHFYTWYGLGEGESERLGPVRYNELKEALTVILNVECKDLFPEGVTDNGYPQHQELRARILDIWSQRKDIRDLWNTLTSSIH